MMIGVYDYTVILTYLSTLSGVIGIIVTMTGIGHPYCGTMFLMISGLLDGFDGKVARTKKNRSDFEKEFGVQIDSLSDLICFGVLPASIGIAQLRVSGLLTDLGRKAVKPDNYSFVLLLITIAAFYVLAALIRLAYFNSTSDQRAEEAMIKGKAYFTGLPVTSAALIFPLTLVLHWILSADLTVFYFWLMLIVAVLFIGNFKVPKPNKKQFAVILVIGLVEFIGTLLILFCA
ncbi:CDP-diacylglycerol---serine O-phosphatidyltransferase [Pseudobutyrivibrio sp. YE44]|uniref:CDP-alcohol phosphatidyltransferase family protein n=1 Tax=Pseudobutyrivibrio sp. YE44 TaxID=1520802 RepID=UPI00087F391C|nr:CDP-alcohol phosphatidyltransferase family protein [Pseudobutyrivibrio sp. YE44]SDB37034.1 CDP-diacylglycerol---serine O-phosphatidyltransferase [Pseudobutyrivibrio sp. YE44]